MPSPGRRKGTYSQAARVLKILEHLRSRRTGVTLAALAEEVGVTERQVRRDLSALEEAGYELSHERIGERSGVRLVEGRSAALQLSLRERYTLLAVRRVFDVLKNTPFFEDVRSIYAKIAASLPSDHRHDLESFGDRFVCLPDGGTKMYRGKEDVIDALLTGVIRRLRVKYTYRSLKGKPRRGVIEPYAMVLYKHGLYTIAKPIEEDGRPPSILVYAVERFSDAEFVRGSDFKMPPDLDIERFFHGAFGIYLGADPRHVVIEFKPEAGRFLEAREWHKTQKLTRASGALRLELDVSELTQVAQWVVGWGPLAKVLEPEELRERVAREHAEAAALYSSKR